MKNERHARVETTGYRLIVVGDESGDGLFDLCHDLYERGAFWVLQHFEHGNVVEESNSYDYEDQLAAEAALGHEPSYVWTPDDYALNSDSSLNFNDLGAQLWNSK